MQSTLTRHIDNVIAVGTGARPPLARDNLVHRSWTRCIRQHGLDPTRPTPARILPSTQLREHQQRMDAFLGVARAGMEDLYQRVADLGYMLLLTDASGITVDYIGNPASEPQLKAAGLYVGADWNEAHAGTCGVGTCLIEQTTITCHQAEHFDATHIALTCTSAPLFAPDGQILGVLDVSALHSPEERESQHLVRHMTAMYAQMIEDANFLRSFGKHWILRLGKSRGLVEVSGDVMFAFDEDGVILGANTGARRRFGSAGGGGPNSCTLVDRTLSDVLGVTMDALWNIARGGAKGEMLGLRTLQHEHFYPAMIAPRLRPAGLVQRVAAPAPMLPDARAFADGRDSSLDRLAGGDATMQRLITQSKRLVDRKVNLLILGETGSGKEVLAKALHDYSSRANKPFVAVNCASIPESLIESELFGYTPGSFTGGKSKGMKGLIAQADGGTLFLDEIGDMPLHLQTRFLRVLSESEVLPLGADTAIAVDLNVIAATHRDLKDRVEAGSFREDLYYRLSGATLSLPALRQRQDKEYLLDLIFDEEARHQGLRSSLTPAARDLILSYPWPGNVRELRNALRYALALSGNEPVSPSDLPATVCGPCSLRPNAPGADCQIPDGPRGPDDAADEPDEGARRLVRSLRQNKWCVTSTAQSLNICRATVYRQMKRFGITPPNQM